MAKTKAPLPSSEITEVEVLGWFPKTKFGEPDSEGVRAFAEKIEFARKIIQCDDEVWKRSCTNLTAVANAARQTRMLLEKLLSEAGSYADLKLSQEVQAAILGLNPFTAVPPKARGPEAGWIGIAAEWAPMIAACLAKPGNKSPSFKTELGPVVIVLERAIFRVYGERKSVEIIGSRLRELKPADFGRAAKARAEKLKVFFPKPHE